MRIFLAKCWEKSPTIRHGANHTGHRPVHGLSRRARTGEPRGITADLACELARRLAVPVDFVIYDGAGKIVAAAASDEWDVAFMAIDPLRAEQILFTPPYLIIEGTYLVRSDSPFRSVEEIDRAGVRIAVGEGAKASLSAFDHLIRTSAPE